MSTIMLDSYEPDWEETCYNCGQTPCVTGVKDKKIISRTFMCGPCTFGTAAALDPDWWNSDED